MKYPKLRKEARIEQEAMHTIQVFGKPRRLVTLAYVPAQFIYCCADLQVVPMIRIPRQMYTYACSFELDSGRRVKAADSFKSPSPKIVMDFNAKTHGPICLLLLADDATSSYFCPRPSSTDPVNTIKMPTAHSYQKVSVACCLYNGLREHTAARNMSTSSRPKERSSLTRVNTLNE